MWSDEGTEPWVVEVLRWGYQIPFRRAPTLSRDPIPFPAYCPNSIRGKALEGEVQSLLAKGAIELAPLPSPGFYSRLFVVMKASGAWRPVIDLGVVITNDLKSSNQCIEAVKKAQKLLGYIKLQFRTRNKETILTLYNALVRPHLEYAVQFWLPSLRKDIERLEAVQARATKLIPSIRHLGYVRRLDRLNLYSLEKRRLRGQLIETFKMLKGVNNIDYRHLFTFSNNRTRSNGWKLELKTFNTSQCGNFFTYKIAPIWNRLPA